jgi:hypothetical protein
LIEIYSEARQPKRFLKIRKAIFDEEILHASFRAGFPLLVNE